MMGIGGGTVGVPAMTLCGVPIHRAVGTASAFGAIISIPGAIGAAIAGWGVAGLPPYSLGYVELARLPADRAGGVLHRAGGRRHRPHGRQEPAAQTVRAVRRDHGGEDAVGCGGVKW